MITSSRVSVTTTRVQLVGYTTVRREVTVRNTHTTAGLLLGGSDATSTNGFEVPPGGAMSLSLDPGDRLYALATTGTVVAHLLVNALGAP